MCQELQALATGDDGDDNRDGAGSRPSSRSLATSEQRTRISELDRNLSLNIASGQFWKRNGK